MRSLAFCLVASLAVPVLAGGRKGDPDEPKPMIRWEASSLDAALKRATDENKPLLVAINMDAEAANEEMTATTYRNPRLLEASEKTLNLIASAATHPHRLEILPDGTKRKLCTRFLTVTCEEHQAVEKAVRKAYFRNAEEMIAPQHLTLRPDGTLIQLKQYQITAKELESLIQEAVQVVGKPRTPNGQTAARKGARKKTR